MTTAYDNAGRKTAIVAGHVPEDVAQALADHARAHDRAHDRTVSAEVRIAVREYLARLRRGNEGEAA